MSTNKNIQEQVNSTLDVYDAIETAKVSPFFKDKTMQRIFSEKDQELSAWSWFTPKIQLATLVCLVILNVVALTQMKLASYDQNISEFAETYGLTTTTENTFLN